MASEKSIVSKLEIRTLVRGKYNLQIQNIKRIDSGSANIYYLQDINHNEFILKEFQSKYNKEKLKYESVVNKLLIKKGFPTSEIIPCSNGEYVWEFKNRAFHLQEYASGITYSQNEAPKWLLDQSIVALAKIHELLKVLPKLPEGLPKSKWNEGSINKKKEKVKKLIVSYNKLDQSCPLHSRALEDLKYKLKTISKIINPKIEFDKLTVKNTHGDFNINQIICKNNSISSIIDFSAVHSLPIGWEIIRSFTYAHSKSKSGEIHLPDFIEYVKRYKEFSDINSYDIISMPMLYYAQLSRSVYGYKEYLNSKNQSLLEFTIWRTDLRMFLERNMEKLQYELSLIS